MPGPASAISVVVSTYDEKRWTDLVACMRSLGEQTRQPLETILVVDHNPSLLERAREELTGGRVMANDRSRGLAGARNAGVGAAKGEVIAFIDDDARAEPGWIEQLESCFEDAAVVGAGGALIPDWEGSEPRWIPPEFYWVFGCSYTGLPERLGPVRNPIGANMAVRAGVLREVDGFREGDAGSAPREIRSRGVVRAAGNVPDDTDLAIRVSQLRQHAVWLYQPQARVLHTVTAERASLRYFLRRCHEEGAGKANLSRYVGSADGLRSERRHLAVTLPRGVARGLRDVVEGDPHGAQRAAAIVLGVIWSGAGFVTAKAVGLLQRGIRVRR
jgi:glycosyltransferase involved in cell wall biosynthesis